MALRVSFLKKRKFRMQNLGKEWKRPPGVILQQKNFYNIFILCLWLRIIRRSDQGVYFMNFPSQIFFLIPFYMTVASYCYYENVRRTMRTTIASYVLNCFYSFSVAELDNIESEDEVFAQEFSYEGSDYEDSNERMYIWQVIWQLFSFK